MILQCTCPMIPHHKVSNSAEMAITQPRHDRTYLFLFLVNLTFILTYMSKHCSLLLTTIRVIVVSHMEADGATTTRLPDMESVLTSTT